MTENELKNLISETLSKAAYLYDEIFPELPVKMTLTGSCAGRFQYCYSFGKFADGSFNFNREIMEANNGEFWKTVIHEIAHYVVHRRFGRTVKPHGPEWKSIMVDLGVDNPTAKHSYQMGSSYYKRRPIKMACSCSEHWITKNKYMKYGETLQCRKCKSMLKYAGIETDAPAPVKKEATPAATFTVKDIVDIMHIEPKKVRVLLRKHADKLPPKHGKSWVFNTTDKEKVLAIIKGE